MAIAILNHHHRTLVMTSQRLVMADLNTTMDVFKVNTTMDVFKVTADHEKITPMAFTKVHGIENCICLFRI
jgi:hypothetical protein